MSVHDAVRWFFWAVEDVSSNCDKNCFSKSGTYVVTNKRYSELSEDDEISILRLLIENNTILSDYENINENLIIEAGF